MQKRHVVLGTYNHAPEGIDAETLESIYQTSYRPFLSVLNRFPEISVVLHYSGSLLRRMQERHPEFLMLLEEMVARKQVELIGGGFYAPLMPLVSIQDRIGQIELLTTFIRKHFGKRPRGSWITQYAWEPSLASSLRTSGMDFTFLLDKHFEAAGMVGQSLFEPVLTEDQGKTIAVFPCFDGSQSFKNQLGFIEIIGELERTYTTLERPISVLMLPGESAYALWRQSGLESPDLYFEKTFNELRKAALVYETIHASRYLRSRKHFNQAYFSCCASSGLLAPFPTMVDQTKKNGIAPTHSGTARAAVLHSEESTNLYAKMQYVHILVAQLRGDKSRKKNALEGLWLAQSGDAYWRAPQGGLLELGVRDAAYAALIETERTTRSKGVNASAVVHADIDFDGEKECLFQGNEYNAYIQLKGATLFEFDLIKHLRNIANSFSCPNHEGHPASARCFADTLVLKDEKDRAFSSEDLSHALFSLRESKRPNSEIILGREISVKSGSRTLDIAMEKSYSFRKNACHLIYTIANRSDTVANIQLSSRSVWTPSLSPQTLVAAVSGIDRTTEIDATAPYKLKEATKVSFQETLKKIAFSLSFDKTAEIALAPVFLDQRSLGASDKKSYQGHALVASWHLQLKPDKAWQTRISLELDP